MTQKNGNVVLLWLAGGLLALSLLFPDGFSVSKKPENAEPVAVKVTDPQIVRILAEAGPKDDSEEAVAEAAADRERINGLFSALIVILRRDGGKRVTTTEQWETLLANTLQLATDKPKKYAGLDEAIETVFENTLGTKDVLPGNPDTLSKLISACEIVANSAAVPVAPKKK